MIHYIILKMKFESQRSEQLELGLARVGIQLILNRVLLLFSDFFIIFFVSINNSSDFDIKHLTRYTIKSNQKNKWHIFFII